MRAFTVACLIAVVIVVGAVVIRDNFMQRSAAAAFTEPTAKV